MTEISVRELMETKKELESKINSLLLEFSNKFFVKVINIELDSTTSQKFSPTIINKIIDYKVDLDIRLQ